MGFNDLRSFLGHLQDSGELVTVSRPVDPRFELAAYCREGLDRRGPALRFDNVTGHSIPVVANLFATRSRFAAAIDTTPDRLHRDWSDRLASPLPPVLVDSGPVREVVWRGDDIDLTRLPVPVWNELDGGPYISLGVQISKDPDTKVRNAATYRVQVHDRNTLGMLYGPYRHLAMQQAKRPGEPFPVVIALGMDPASHIAAGAPLPYGVDELAVAGALRGEPVPLVPCETIDAEAPADAEIVLECEILPGVLRDEGPYGEFTGFYGSRAPRPVLRVTCVTMRRNPIFLGAYQGRPPQDSTLMQSIPAEAEILRSVTLAGVKDIAITESGCGAFTAVVSAAKPTEGYGRMVALAVLGTWGGRYIKQLTVVTDEIDPHDHEAVEWAVATRVQPHRDVEILRNLVGIILDPSLPDLERQAGYSRTSKMIIDATGYKTEHAESILCMPPLDVMERVRASWDEVVPGT